MRAVVLLSGGMDSCVALFQAGFGREEYRYDHIDGIFFHYGQEAAAAEAAAAFKVWDQYKASFQDHPGSLHEIALPSSMFFSPSSILGRSLVNTYDDVEQAIQNTPHDKSYIPFRNGVFFAIAGHFLASKLESLGQDAGDIVTGIRGRVATGAPPGFPDCTSDFITKMHDALMVGTGKRIGILDVLNYLAPTREKTLLLARDLPGCWAALASTVSCFKGCHCGECLPCRRRAQAFAAIGRADPALEGRHGQ